MFKIIVLNPGSTSTKIALYEDDSQVFSKNIDHNLKELAKFDEIVDQLDYRKEVIINALKEDNIDINGVHAFSAMCTGLMPMEGGVYEVNETMYAHGKIGPGSKHPGNLGPLLAKDFADKFQARAFIVDGSSVDEFIEEARMTGFVEVLRTSRGHPLNQRSVARKFAKDINKNYEDLNLIVAHLGGGMSVGAHFKGKMIDNVDSTRGEGRMAPTRSGAAPLADVIEMCYSNKYSKNEMISKVMKTGGWTAHLNTADAREIEKMIEDGNEYASLVYRTTAYQISKDIASMAAVMDGEVDSIILTGGVAYSKLFTNMISEKVEFIAPVNVYAGEFEMDALALGAYLVLKEEESPKYYNGEPIFPGFDVLYKEHVVEQ